MYLQKCIVCTTRMCMYMFLFISPRLTLRGKTTKSCSMDDTIVIGWYLLWVTNPYTWGHPRGIKICFHQSLPMPKTWFWIKKNCYESNKISFYSISFSIWCNHVFKINFEEIWFKKLYKYFKFLKVRIKRILC